MPKRTAPCLVHDATAVLARLGHLAVACHHRVDRACGGLVTLQDQRAQLLISAGFAQLLELGVQVEHQGWRRKSPTGPAGARVKDNHEERLASEAEGEVRAVRFCRHALVHGMPEPGILVGQGLDPIPQVPLEAFLAQGARPLEDYREALEQVGLQTVARGKG